MPSSKIFFTVYSVKLSNDIIVFMLVRYANLIDATYTRSLFISNVLGMILLNAIGLEVTIDFSDDDE